MYLLLFSISGSIAFFPFVRDPRETLARNSLAYTAAKNLGQVPLSQEWVSTGGRGSSCMTSTSSTEMYPAYFYLSFLSFKISIPFPIFISPSLPTDEENEWKYIFSLPNNKIVAFIHSLSQTTQHSFGYEHKQLSLKFDVYKARKS